MMRQSFDIMDISMTWREYLLLDDAAFERQCVVTHTKGSGPGGQKRNKTSSAVRITHSPSGIFVRAEESRSQKSNRKHAFQRLRQAIAFGLRAPPEKVDLDRLLPSRTTDVAPVLDVLESTGYVLASAAALLNATTGALSSFICTNEDLHTEVNRQRARLGLRPLRN